MSSHHVVDGQSQSVGEALAGLFGVEPEALWRGGVQRDGHQLAALQHTDASAATSIVGEHFGRDEKFGKIACYEVCLVNVFLRCQELQQPVAHRAGSKYRCSVGEEVPFVLVEQENRVDVQVVNLSFAVDSPQTLSDIG